jgi:hypothetical protein
MDYRQIIFLKESSMGDEYIKMMEQSLKMSGMSDEQIEAALAMQKAAMQQYAALDPAALQQAFAGATSSIAGLNMDSYFEFAEKPSINKAYQWAVACGADLAHVRADILNDLSTGGDKADMKEMMAEAWGISSKKDFTAMADSLLAGRHSTVYHQLAEGKNVKDFEEEKENLKEAKKIFKKDKLIGDAVPNMIIWDLGRLINVCRFCFDAGYADRKTALSYIKEAALLIKKNYKSWKDLSIGYQFGRAVWGGLEEYDALKEGMEQLLTEKDSPWVTMAFGMKLNFDE